MKWKSLIITQVLIIVVTMCVASYHPTWDTVNQSGNINVAILETTKTVTFTRAMKSTNYEVLFQSQNSTEVTLWPSDKTKTNCVLNIVGGLYSGNVSWAVIEN